MPCAYEYNLGIRFQTIARQRASETAIWFSDSTTVSYGDLNRLANRAARWFLDQNIQTRDVVCISGTKTLLTFACMIGCLKIGVAYSIMDPDSPVERLRKILMTCRPKMLLAESPFLDRVKSVIEELSISSIEMDEISLGEALSGYEADDLPQTEKITGSNPSYIMYTSGSTGFPKGAVMTHANVLNLIDWARETYRITPEDIQTNVNPLYFDNSVFDFYSSLFNGARLVPFTKDEVRDPQKLVEKIEAAKCTIWFSVPSLLIFLQTMKATDGKYLRNIRCFIFGGEGYPKAKLKNLYHVYSDTSELHNVYGPTECTCICSSYKLSDQDFEDLQGLPPLGNIARNFDFLILDDENQKTIDGEIGELCLLGPNVGRGYFNDPERTTTSFIQNPFNNQYYDIMYRTGDLVRFDPSDGKIYVHGRKDRQIKHMGYRIELEEIESALHRLDYVSEAAALHTRAGGISRIIAVVAAQKSIEGDQLRNDLKQFIPDYMIPSVFYHVDMLPKNPNGKVDRKTLESQYCQNN